MPWFALKQYENYRKGSFDLTRKYDSNERNWTLSQRCDLTPGPFNKDLRYSYPWLEIVGKFLSPVSLNVRLEFWFGMTLSKKVTMELKMKWGDANGAKKTTLLCDPTWTTRRYIWIVWLRAALKNPFCEYKDISYLPICNLALYSTLISE